MQNKTFDDVCRFWESTPLFSGESKFPVGSKAFYEEHRRVIHEDGHCGHLSDIYFPKEIKNRRILDLGCGPGFWVIEFGLRGYQDIVAIDLTNTALNLAQERCIVYGLHGVKFSRQNGEELGFTNDAFAFINCHGVIHHTPDTEAAVREIWRVLENKGIAIISVYYRNIILRGWRLFKWIGKVLKRVGAGMPGRGRENIFTIENIEEIVRQYDGAQNPIGKIYSQKQFYDMLAPYFEIESSWLSYFPARSLPFKIPRWLHLLLDRYCGFMIVAKVRKRSCSAVIAY